MTVRLAEIAERAGVSVASVSRVLNDRPGVAESTREAVLTALDTLGYERPARLQRRPAGLVGLVVPELENPIFPRFAQAAETALVRHGYTPVLCTQTVGGVQEDDYVEALLERGVAGIIFVSGMHAAVDADPERYLRLVERGLPIVLVNGPLPGVPATAISNDDAAAVDLAVGHVAQLGHRRVGLALGQRRYTPASRRAAEFGPALRRHVDPGLSDADAQAMLASTAFTVEGGASAAQALLDRGATALVCASDLMAVGAVRAVRQRGLRVPEDVSVVGSDDSKLIEFTDPPLTTVRQPVAAMGEAAATALLDQVAGLPAATGELVFRPELVVRASTGPAPVSAPGP